MSVYSASESINIDFSKLDAAADDMIDAANVVINKIRPKYNKKAKFALELLGDHAVTQFYDSYGPHVYNRKEDLFNAYKVTANNQEWYIETGQEFMHGGHRASNETIYKNSFELGWHGGAFDSKKGDHPSPGTPYWRAPVGQYTYWLSPAIQGPSPKEIISSELNEYLEPIEQQYGDEACDFLEKYIKKFESVLDMYL